MKKTFLVEMDYEDSVNHVANTLEFKGCLRRGIEARYGPKQSLKIGFKVLEQEVKPLISNVLPFTKIILDHTEDKGFHLAEEQIENEKFPLRFESVPYDKDRDNPYREQR